MPAAVQSSLLVVHPGNACLGLKKWTGVSLMEVCNKTPSEGTPCPPAYCTTLSVMVGYQLCQPIVPGRQGDLPHRTSPANATAAPTAAPPRSGAKGASNAPSAPCPSAANRPSFKFKVPRVLCFDCGTVRQVKFGFADPKKHYTRAFERYVLELSRHMTIQDVANHLQISWDTVKDIQARSLQRRFGKPKLHKLKQIAIDEIAIGKGHRYVTVVLNLLSGVIVFVGDGKGAEALTPFWKRLRRSGAKVVAVATDMSKAYIQAVRDNLPKAVHVFDHFHVIKLFNEKLSALRRDLYHAPEQ